MLERRVPLVRGANGSLRRPKNKKPIAMDGLLKILVAWGSTERLSETRMNARFLVWCMIQLLVELLYAQSLDFF